MSQSVRRIELAGRTIILAGTAHISPESIAVFTKAAAGLK